MGRDFNCHYMAAAKLFVLELNINIITPALYVRHGPNLLLGSLSMFINYRIKIRLIQVIKFDINNLSIFKLGIASHILR